MKIIKNRRSQLTILIIAALIIAVSVALIATLVKNKISGGIDVLENPQAYISGCVQPYLQEAETKILEGNGYIELKDNYAVYNLNKPDEKIPYLCKSGQFYMPCINQEPMLLEKLKKDIQTYTKKDVEGCFENLINEMKKRGSLIGEESLNYSIVLIEDYIIAKMNKKIIVKTGEEQKIFEKFEAKLQSALYNLANTARQIVNYESELCEFNDMNWMMNFKDISIEKFSTSDQTKIYTLKDKLTEKKLSFAIKSCVLPAGI